MIQDTLLKVIIFLIPTQLGLHFWPYFSRVNSVKIDYLSPTLYLIDIFIFAYLVLNFSLLQKFLKKNTKSLVILGLLFLLNLYFSVNPFNTAFYALKLIEHLSFFLCIKQEKSLWQKTRVSFYLSLLLVVSLQLLQQLFQYSLGGPFYYFGERHFSGSTPNLPKATLSVFSFIRVPSVFSHPNSLAGFLGMSFIILNRYQSSLYFRFSVFISLLLTFSKSATLSIILYLSKLDLGKYLYVIFVFLSTATLLLPVLNTGIFSIDSRTDMVSQFRKIPTNKILLGAGLGNYPMLLSNILPGSMSTPDHLQPIHNLFLLLVAELGLPLTLLLVYRLYKTYNPKYLSLITFMFITGFFDHYWLTLPQNKLILLYSLALFSQTPNHLRQSRIK